MNGLCFSTIECRIALFLVPGVDVGLKDLEFCFLKLLCRDCQSVLLPTRRLMSRNVMSWSLAAAAPALQPRRCSRKKDVPAIHAELRRSIGETARMTFLNADICRQDLLMVIEATSGHPMGYPFT